MALKEFTQRTKTVLAGRTTREVTVFGFFVLLSAVAWFMQVLHEDYEMEVEIPVLLTDVPGDVVIVDSLPSSLTVKVGDRGTTLFTSFYLGSPDPVAISFAAYPTPNNVGDIRISRDELHRHVQAVLPNTTAIKHIDAGALHFSYNRGVLPAR